MKKQFTRPLLIVAIAAIFSLSFHIAAQKVSEAELRYRDALHKQQVEGDLNGAINLYQTIIASKTADRATRAKALLQLAACFETLGRNAEDVYQQLVRDFAEQPAAKQAAEKLAALGSARSKPMGMRRVWLPADHNMRPGAPSLDGRLLPFAEYFSSGNLAVRDMETNASRRITNKGDWASSPEYAGGSVFSPDGKRVAFGWNSKREYELRVIGVDGSNEKTVYSSAEALNIWPMAFSPDGTEILATIQTRGQTGQIVWFSIGGGAPRVLKSMPWNFLGNVRLSPDGRYIAHDVRASADSPRRKLFVLNSDASQETELGEGRSVQQVFGWMPDGKWILFSDSGTGDQALWAMPFAEGRASGSPVLLKSDLGGVQPLGITRAGSLLYNVLNRTGQTYVASADWETGKVSNVTPIAHGISPDYEPDFSPDGSFVAYVAHRGANISGQQFLVVHNLKTGADREVIPEPPMGITVQGGYRWSPDGKSFMVPGRDTTHGQSLFTIDVATGKTQFLFERPGSQIQLPDWMPGGDAIIYRLRDQVHPLAQIFIRDLKSGVDRQVITGAENTQHIAMSVSPDGKHVAFVPLPPDPRLAAQALSVVPAAGGSPRVLVQPGDGSNLTVLGVLGWTADSRRVLFSRRDPTSPQSSTFWAVSAEGGTPQRLNLPPGTSLRWLRVHPDGKQIAWTTTDVDQEIWAIDNLAAALSQPAR